MFINLTAFRRFLLTPWGLKTIFQEFLIIFTHYRGWCEYFFFSFFSLFMSLEAVQILCMLL